MSSAKIKQLVDAVVHTVLGARIKKSGGGHVGRVPHAFDTFHLDIEGGEEVSRAIDAVMNDTSQAGRMQGVQVGVFATTAPASCWGEAAAKCSFSLLELWTIERKTPQAKALRKREEDAALRLLLRTIHAAARLLPLHAYKSNLHRAADNSDESALSSSTAGAASASKRWSRHPKLGFFIAPLGSFDSQAGALNPGQGIVTELANPIYGTCRFPAPPEHRAFGSCNVHWGFLQVSVKYVPEAGLPDASAGNSAFDGAPGSVGVNIIGDFYVNSRNADGLHVVPPPFSRLPQQQQQHPQPSGSPGLPPASVGGLSQPVTIPGRRAPGAAGGQVYQAGGGAVGGGGGGGGGGAGGGGAPVVGTPPPPFALTPTPSSFQSASSFSKAFGPSNPPYHPLGTSSGTRPSYLATSVSPPEGSFLSQWTPRLEVASTGAWAPSKTCSTDRDRELCANDTFNSSILHNSHQDISPYMAFLEDEFDLAADTWEDEHER
eukprot:gene14793-22648_t